MILKNSSFNLSLIREVLRRQLWTVTLSAITLFLALPLPVIMTIQNAHAKLDKTNVDLNSINDSTTNTIFYMLSIDNLFIKILMVSLAIISGISVFSYLHSKEKTDFYHSLPISRNKLFTTRFIGGIITVIPAYIINFLLALTIASSFGYTDTLSLNILLLSVVSSVVFFLAIYSTGALCAILCGNTIISMLLFAWVSFSLSVCIILVNYLQDSFYKTFVSGSLFSEKLISRLSPIIQYFFITTKAYDYDNGVNVFLFSGSDLWLWLAVYFAVFVCITLLAIWLNKFRYSEKAGSAIAFEKLKSPLKFYMVTVTAIGMGLLFREIVNPFWMYVGFFIGGLLCHMIVEITYHFDFKAIFKNIKWFSVYSVIFALFITGMYFDITGFDRYLPGSDSLKSVNVTLDNYLSYSYSNSPDAPLKDPNNIALVCKLAEIGIAQRNDNFDSNSDSEYRYVEIKFDKKFGGAKSREYKIKTDEVSTKLIDALRYSKEYKAKRLPLFTLDENKTEVLAFMGPLNIGGNSNPDLIFDKPQIKEIIASTREEWNTLTPEYLAKVAPVGLMCAESDKLEIGSNGKYEYRADYYSDQRIPIYPCFKKTLALIKKYGEFEPKSITIDDVSSIVLNISTEHSDENDKIYSSKEETVTNPLDIAVILQNAIVSNLAYSADPNFKINNDISIRVKLKDNLSEVEMIFPADNVPLEVLDQYK